MTASRTSEPTFPQHPQKKQHDPQCKIKHHASTKNGQENTIRNTEGAQQAHPKNTMVNIGAVGDQKNPKKNLNRDIQQKPKSPKCTPPASIFHLNTRKISHYSPPSNSIRR
ncbi:MAG: hypothetical protein U5M23_02415 [Marinagarivorans sp.]|nr:hypothetical protein [Marinagarivorans sp.]